MLTQFHYSTIPNKSEICTKNNQFILLLFIYFCSSESDVEVKIILFAGQLTSLQPEILLQPIQNLSGIHINNSDAATATITQCKYGRTSVARTLMALLSP